MGVRMWIWMLKEALRERFMEMDKRYRMEFGW